MLLAEGELHYEAMTRPEPMWAGVAELSDAITARPLSLMGVVDALLMLIKKREALHAYFDVYEWDAHLAVEAADRVIRSRLPPARPESLPWAGIT